MIWNNIPDNERLHLWKNLRTDIKGLDITEQMIHVSKFFASIPFGTRTIDYYSTENWPTPWEIIFHGSLCRSSISLLIFYTFSLINTDHIIDLRLIDDGNDEYLLPVIDNQFVLNYELGKVSNLSDIKSEITEKITFTEHQIKKIA
jgi:hypothetical protein